MIFVFVCIFVLWSTLYQTTFPADFINTQSQFNNQNTVKNDMDNYEYIKSNSMKCANFLIPNLS